AALLTPAGATRAGAAQTLTALIVLAAGVTVTLGREPSWLRAGQTARAILEDLHAGRPEPADYTIIYAAGLPAANEDALIFRTGFPEAVQMAYGNPTIEARLVPRFPVVEARLNQAYLVEYQDGRLVARDDLVEVLQARNRGAKQEQPGADLSAAGDWALLAGTGTVTRQGASTIIAVPAGGTVRLPGIAVPALALGSLRLTARLATGGAGPAAVRVEWLVDTPAGLVARANALLVLAADGQAQAAKIKPPDMSAFFIDDTVREIRLTLPAGLDTLTVEQAVLYRIP
ncbi:MAG TPA: hypothetical protein VM536_10430, partial [Chloroflexia bacterium]|nr:hypothetical protein [Chloroflexia bacterium]